MTNCYRFERITGEKGVGICVGVVPAGDPVPKDKIRVCIGQVGSEDEGEKNAVNMTPEEAIRIAERLYNAACMVREFVEQRREKEAER